MTLDLIKVNVVAITGLTLTLANIDMGIKIIIGCATLFYIGIKIYKELKK